MASLSEGWAKLNSPVNIRDFNRMQACKLVQVQACAWSLGTTAAARHFLHLGPLRGSRSARRLELLFEPAFLRVFLRWRVFLSRRLRRGCSFSRSTFRAGALRGHSFHHGGSGGCLVRGLGHLSRGLSRLDRFCASLGYAGLCCAGIGCAGLCFAGRGRRSSGGSIPRGSIRLGCALCRCERGRVHGGLLGQLYEGGGLAGLVRLLRREECLGAGGRGRWFVGAARAGSRGEHRATRGSGGGGGGGGGGRVAATARAHPPRSCRYPPCASSPRGYGCAPTQRRCPWRRGPRRAPCPRQASSAGRRCPRIFRRRRPRPPQTRPPLAPRALWPAAGSRRGERMRCGAAAAARS